MLFRFRLYIKRHHGRMVKLEMSIDRKRSTSGLNEDGTSDHD